MASSSLTSKCLASRVATRDKPWTHRPVVMVGAGFAGLTLAQVLKFAGVPFTILERSSDPSSESKELVMGLAKELFPWAWKPLEPVLGQDWPATLAPEKRIISREAWR